MEIELRKQTFPELRPQQYVVHSPYKIREKKNWLILGILRYYSLKPDMFLHVRQQLLRSTLSLQIIGIVQDDPTSFKGTNFQK